MNSILLEIFSSIQNWLAIEIKWEYKGIKKARGQFIVRVDSDDYVHVDFLKILSLHLQLNHSIDAIASDYLLVNNDQDVIKEMNKISKDTTENALRDLAKSQLEKKENIISSDESDTDDSYTNMSDNNYVSVKEYNKIEEKCRMQELKIMNTEISFNDEMKYFSNKFPPKTVTKFLIHSKVVINM